MQPAPNSGLRLDMRPLLPSSGQGPSISALAQQQQQQQMLHQPFHIMAPPTQTRALFVGPISGGISDDILNRLLGIRALTMASSPSDLQ
ncbi:hypothetical protein BKA82DRAFT_637633 [Pisolithus tinctorius]|uniref:Uncharacterized protein n=1 Tax=Pisolithus tinctorius Marx 270 TaxID=870435 RepID=A0A0C3P5Y6_PISTI|nr:hypothetical protein BKA82DRAFT_637633 [Pisolithus tinctorius]KIO02921.1 hypothetical protein M404DRAFT_637633 [Pisolithus tinctorius Marx 270]